MSNKDRWDCEREKLKTISLDDAANELSNEIYQHSSILESLEYAGHRVIGNGHHMRQELSALSEAYMVACWDGTDEEKFPMVKKIVSGAHSRVRPHVMAEIMGVDYPLIDPTKIEEICFKEFLEMDDHTVQVLITELGDDNVLVFLKSAPGPVLAKVYKNVSNRKEIMLREDVELTNFRSSDLESAVRSAGYSIFKNNNGFGSETWKIGYGCTPSLSQAYWDK